MDIQKNAKALAMISVLFPMWLALNALAALRRAWQRFLGGTAPLPPVLRTPDERFDNLPGYPFKPNYYELPFFSVALRMHYLDVAPVSPPNSTALGGATTVLLLHGEPSWSYLYRRMIPRLSRAGYRVIAPDFIGFGRSDKLTSVDAYTHALHIESLLALVRTLDLNRVLLVVQDWGGLVGLSALPQMAERVAALCVMNTGLPTAGDLPGSPLAAVARGPRTVARILPFLVWQASVALLQTDLPVAALFKYVALKRRLTSDEARAYGAPFPDRRYRAGAAVWPLLVPLRATDPVAPYMRRAAEFLEKDFEQPALIAFSTEDPITRSAKKQFERLLARAPTTVTDVVGAGHFLQEDSGEELAELIVEWLRGDAEATEAD